MGFMTGLGGFSEGFGKAFANSFSEAKQLSARAKEKKEDRENDIFLQTMRDNQETLKELDSAKKKDAAIVAKVKTISQTYGLDAKTTALITQRARDSGGDTSEIEDLVKNGTFTSSAATNLTTNSSINQTRMEAPTNQAPGLDTQTESAMGTDTTTVPNPMADATETSAPVSSSIIRQPASPGGVDMGDGITYTRKAPKPDWNQNVETAKEAYRVALTTPGTDDDAAAKAELDRIRSTNEIVNPSRVTGRTKYDLQNEYSLAVARGDTGEADRIQTMMTQVETAEANSKVLSENREGMAVVAVNPDGSRNVTVGIPRQGPEGQLVYTDAQGNMLPGARAQTKDEKEEIQRIRQSLASSKPVQDQNTAVASTVSTIRSAQRLKQMIQQDPSVLSTQAAGAAQLAEGFFSEIKTAGRILGMEVKENDQGAIDNSQIDALKGRLDNIDISSIEDTAAKKSLFDAEMMILAYRAGRGEGQSGPSFTKDDYNKITKSIRTDSNNPKVVDQAIDNYVSGLIKNTELGGKVIESNPDIRQFKNTYGYVPTSQITPTIQDMIQNSDPELMDTYNSILANGGKLINPEAVKQGTNQVDGAKPQAPTIPSKAVDLLKSRPELREQFDAKYGKGASASVLGQ